MLIQFSVGVYYKIIIINKKSQMFKRLFVSNEIQKAFIQSKIDNKHDMISTRRVLDLAVRYLLPKPKEANPNYNINININNNINSNINININHTDKITSNYEAMRPKRDEFVKYILKKIRSQKEVVRIKTLIVCHSIIKKTFDEQFMEIIADQLDKYIKIDVAPNQKLPNFKLHQQKNEIVQVKLQTQHHRFIQNNIISFFCFYLKKLIMNIQTYQYCRQFVFNSKIISNTTLIQVIKHGFIVVNLVNFILESQATFNKMGRYYLQHEEIINLFLAYLYDLTIYNSFFKQISRVANRQIKNASAETVKHRFLFLTQAQKCSDRFYQFFYNRYYYRRVKEIITMPSFFTIDNQQFKEIADHLKKIDKQLYFLVNNSKYTEQQQGRFRSKTATTILNQRQELQNKTVVYESTKQGFENMISYIKDDQLQKSFQDFQMAFKTKSFKLRATRQ